VAVRKITVRDEVYTWALTPSDDGLRIVIRSGERGGSKLFAWFSHDVLVTPYIVRIAIERGLDKGWKPRSIVDGNVRFEEPIVDRNVAVVPPTPLGARELALLDRVAESDDDHSRQVYADWLLERGDPQGELIALHSSGRELTAIEQTRVRELDALRMGWLGPVAEVIGWPVWAHGMLVGAKLARVKSGVVDAALGHRAWRTLRKLDARGRFLAPSDVVRLVAQPVLRDLRELSVSLTVALELAFTPFEHLRVTRFAAIDGRGAPTAPMLAALCERMPSLHTLVLPQLAAKRFSEIAAANAAHRLVIRDATSLRHAKLLGDSPLAELACCPYWTDFDSARLTMVLRRAGDRAWSSLSISGELDEHQWPLLMDGLAHIAADSIVELHIDQTKPPYNNRRLIGMIRRALAPQPRLAF
jgi:uncharacterized protein (TIGR02996 family)